MPQTSPMNWMMISTIFITMYFLMKTMMNTMFKSSSQNSKKMKLPKTLLKW